MAEQVVNEMALEPRKLKVLRGSRAMLRPLNQDHVGERYLGWLNDPRVNRYLESRFAPHDLDSIARYVEKMAASPDYYVYGIHWMDTAEHVGNIKLGPIDPNHRNASVGFLIGEITAQGKGLAVDSVRAVTDFAFGELKLEKLTAGAYAVNTASHSVFDRLGWSREGLRRRHQVYEGGRVDVIEFGLLADEWKVEK